MKSLKFVRSLAVIIAVLLFSIIYLTIHVDSQNVPSLGLLHYMYKNHPNMKLQHCIEAADQCRLFSSCKGLYLHLPTGECLFDNSTVKSDEFTLTTTEAKTEEVAVSTEPITEQVSMTTKTTPELVTTSKPFNNRSYSIQFKRISIDHKIYAKRFDTTELSACFWMKPESNNAAGIFSIFQSPNNYYCNDFLILYKSNQLVFLRNTELFNSGYLKTAKQFWIGQSYHVCFRWSMKELIFYVDGVFDKKYTVDHEKLVANHFVIGNDLDEKVKQCEVNDASQSFLGEIAGLNAWNRVLNESEIENIYSKGLIPSNDLAVAWNVLNFETTYNIKKKDFVV